MKKFTLLFSLVFIFFVFSVNAQIEAASWDSTYRPGSYKIKTEQFKNYLHTKHDIVFLGNSITAGVDWHELLQINNAHNRGISGDSTFGVLERLDEVISGKPSKVFILIGINDISRNIPDSIIISNYKKIVSRIIGGSPETQIFIQSILPVNNTFTKFKRHYNKDEHILAINNTLKEIALEYGVVYIDLHLKFLDAQKRLNIQYTHDGLHLNARGYRNWAEILKHGGYL